MKTVTRVWTFKSDSNTSKSYETLQYDDGTTSCGCMGWTRRIAADGSRSCKHTRMVDMGIADRECTASHDYRQAAPRRAAEVAPQANLAAPARKEKGPKMTVIGARKVLFNRKVQAE
jgi:hypothetical protein